MNDTIRQDNSILYAILIVIIIGRWPQVNNLRLTKIIITIQRQKDDTKRQ